MPGRLRGVHFESGIITPTSTVADVVAHRMGRVPQKVWIEWLTHGATTDVTAITKGPHTDVNVSVTVTFAGTAPTYKIHAIV